jgi:single-strand DNA-binding protein
MSVNKVILIGNLGKDPEVRFTANGKALARFPIATSEVWIDGDGHRQERTEWHNIIVWGKQGESCGQYLAKGRQVFVEGSIRTRTYDDKSGKAHLRIFAEITDENDFVDRHKISQKTILSF